jgi:small conductance mechanosensitive channel
MNRELQRFYDKALDWLFVAGPHIIAAAITLVIGLWLIKLLRRKLSRHIHKKNVHASLRPFIESLVFTALHIALFLLVMQMLGIQLTIFAAVIAAFGAAAGLALSGTLQNFASGILILLLKPFKTGDNIISQGIEGTVSSIRIFYTVITTFDNRTVIMPNNKLSNEIITNVTRIGSRRLDIELSFPASVPVQSLRSLLSNALHDIPEVCKEPEFRLGVSAVAADSYKFMINIWLKAHGFEDTRMKINEYLLEFLNRELPALKEKEKPDAPVANTGGNSNS